MALETRKRSIPYPGKVKAMLETSTANEIIGVRVSKVTEDVAFPNLTGKQITASENHPMWNAKHKWGVSRGDIGGDFSSFKQYVEGNPRGSYHMFSAQDTDRDGTVYTVRWQGPYLPLTPLGMTFPPPRTSSNSELDKLGTEAISKCSPTNPTIDLTTTVGELIKDGLPKAAGSLLTKKGMSNSERRKAIGDEYLNKEFGIDPLISDLTDVAVRILEGDASMRQFLRDSGRMVRRGYDFPVAKSETATEWMTDATPWCGGPTSTRMSVGTRLGGRVVLVKTSTRRRWFRGAFTYYVPGATATGTDAIARAVIQAKKTLGIRLTPDAIWNLMPWSWAVDWFVNTDQVLKNWSAMAIDNQVLVYGYMMEHTIDKYTYHFIGSGVGEYPHRLRTKEIPMPVTLVTESKIRRRATPYGFGLTWDGFSAFQKSILAALGLSKTPTKKKNSAA